MTERKRDEYDVIIKVGPWRLRREKQKRRRSPNTGSRGRGLLWPPVVLVVAVLITCTVEPKALDVIRAIVSLMSIAP